VSRSSFEREIAENGKLIYTNIGDSMMPLIRQGKDLVVIVKKHGRLKKYDVPLYRRDNGQYVLHRVLEVRKNDYVICGDNRWKKEYGITDRHIIGVLSGVIRSGKNISVNNRWYRLYVHLWCDLFPLRAFALKVISKLKRELKKIKK